MTSPVPNMLADLEHAMQAGQWREVLDEVFGHIYPGSPFLQEAWRATIGSDRQALVQACRLAVQEHDVQRVRAWWTLLAPGQRRGQQLRARLGERRLICAAELIRAAGLVLSARDLQPVAPGQPPDLRPLCAWVDEVVEQEAFAETLLQRLLQRLSHPEEPPEDPSASRLARLSVDTLCALLAARHSLAPERLAWLRAGAHVWLGAAQPEICREVPIAYVAVDGEGRVDDTLVVEILTPGSGQSMQHPADVLRLPEAPLVDHIDEAFHLAIQQAFHTACRLAQRTDVDLRWRLRRGAGQAPVLAAQGPSASGQALRACYSALTHTWLEPEVFMLAQVTVAGQLDSVDGITAKTRAIVQAVQRRRHTSPSMARRPDAQNASGCCDTLVVVSPTNAQQARDVVHSQGAADWLRVVQVNTPLAACQTRSQVLDTLERDAETLAQRVGHQGWYQAATPLRFVHLTLLLDHGPEAEAGRWQAAPQTFTDLRAVLAHVPERAIVVLGPPGSGKSTLLRHYELESTRLALASTADTGPAALPFFVALNDYRPAQPGAPLPPPRAWLAARWAARHAGLPDLETLLHERPMLLLLDALNEMPAASDEAVALWSACLRELAQTCPETRLVFTCRSLDYSAPLSSRDCPVPQVRIEALTDAQVEAFLQRYSPEWGETLWAQLQGSPQLELFRLPYYLHLLVQQSQQGQIPPGRAALFTGFLWQALRREVEQRHPLFEPDMLTPYDRGRLLRASISPATLPERGLLLPGLSDLAWAMQQRGLRTEGTQVRVTYDEALALLASHSRAEDLLRAGTALAVLDQDPQADTVRYMHQLLQEYFAARRLALTPDPTLVQQAWRATEVVPDLQRTLDALSDSEPLPPLDSSGWEETTVLAAAMASQLDVFVEGVMASNLPLAGRCAAEPGVQVSEPLRHTLRQALLARTQDPAADLRARIAAGLALGQLGDPRLTRHEGRYGAYLLPPLITIPGGTYAIGSDEGDESESPAHEVVLQSFAIGQSPVTNAEWALFMQAGGYEEARWWQCTEAQAWRRGEETAGGAKQERQEFRKILQARVDEIRQWHQQGHITSQDADVWEAMARMSDTEFEELLETWYPPGPQTQPAYWYDDAFNNPGQPVVGICWFEARAYCAWLSAQTGQSFRLPTEVEWEAAARGQQGRRYAYGEVFDAACCNGFETHIRRTTPIGVFPGGATPEGLVDMTGNVWEWTSSLYQDYPYDAADGREDVNATSARRVLRGGSWGGDRRSARASFRGHDAPGGRDGGTGLRLVRVVPFS